MGKTKASSAYTAYWSDAGERLRTFWRDERPHRADVGVGYFAHPDAPRRMHEIAPSARLVFSLREPVARTVSHYWYRWERQRENLPIEQAIREHGNVIIEHSRYRTNVNRYLEYFNPQQMMFVLFDDLVRDTASVMRSIFEFLDVEPNVEINFAVINGSGNRGLREPLRLHDESFLRELFAPEVQDFAELAGIDIASVWEYPSS